MNETTTFFLDPAEEVILKDSEYLLIKRNIIRKHEIYFERIGAKFKCESANTLLKYKVSKGENFLGLPYIVLDAPSYWGKEQIIALRCMLLWGRGYYVHLIQKNMIQKEVLSEILNSNFFYTTEKDLIWEHRITSAYNRYSNQIETPEIAIEKFSLYAGWNLELMTQEVEKIHRKLIQILTADTFL